ncbi:ABC transporter permease subunit [Lentzea sp. NPDC060358]|uniref:ABC transporter permease subunit n=1 Tax=Lentzea sp. NPDC060358 TaxID=3347103 RepID=UPI00364DD4A3
MVAVTAPRRELPRKALVVGGVVLAWLVLWLVFRNSGTLPLDASELTPLHRWVNEVNDAVGASRNSNPVFLHFFNEIRLVVDEFVTFVQALVAQPSFGRPVPVVGWLGVVAVAGFASLVVAGWRVALLAVAGFVLLGLQGLWQESMDTLSLTLAAVVIALLFGIPLGIWAGLSDRARRVMTPVLDFMQTMPTFVYLAPLTLFFLIGPASATIATLIYAAPPAIRITAHAIRSVPRDTVEASESLGATGGQTLVKVLLPSARKTIVLGVNQTIMAALSMVTIAALIDAPGLGKTVVKALQTLDVGTAFNAGLAIVVLAIVLDRVTTAATERRTLPRWALFGGLGVTGVAVYFSHTYLWAAEFPSEFEVGSSIRQGATAATEWVQDSLPVITGGVKDFVTWALINPLQALLAESPWLLVALVVVALSFLVGGVRSAVVSAACLGLLIATGLWQDAMVTLASTLVATIMVMVLGVVVGVWMGRSRRADRVIRPVLDAGQVMPAFVYLVPFLALFSASRFTAIIAAVVFAAPVAIKIIADGVRAVPPAAVEASAALGSSSWQTIVKVQLPMARGAVTLAANQGLIHVLSMVVVGGLVGAGALGYDVVAGFSQGQLYGKGLAAGVAIVVLGVMLDRLTQAAAKRWTNQEVR